MPLRHGVCWLEWLMRLSTLLLLTTASLGAGGLAWTEHCRAQAELQMRVFAARIEPIGELRYRQLRAWPWGRGSLRDVSLQLSSAAAEPLGLREGDSLRVEQIDVLDYRLGEDQTPETLDLRWQGLHWPLPADAEQRGSPQRALSRLRELGLDELRIDGTLNLQFLPDARSLRLRFDGRSESLAALEGELSLLSGPEWFLGRFDELELSRARLDYRDRGLLAQLRQSPTLRGLLAEAGAADDPATPASSGVEASGLQGEQAARLRGFLREPRALRLVLDPPGRLQLRDLPLYARAALPQVLGLELSAPPDAPAP